jgi:hypothetical protein
MRDPAGSHDFSYVDSDIPEGMTVGDWRAQRAAQRCAQRAARRDRVRARRVFGHIAAALARPPRQLARPSGGGRRVHA